MNTTTANYIGYVIQLITVLITQFFVYFGLKREFINSINIQKNKRQVDNLSVAMKITGSLLDDIIKYKERLNHYRANRKFIAIKNLIIAYGTLEDYKIFSEICKNNFRRYQNDSQNPNIILYPLLLSQMHYEIVGEIVNPEYWFIMHITDFYDNRDYFVEKTNEAIIKLGLKKELLMKW